MRFGINMFGQAALFNKDKEGFLQKVSKMGYRYIEPCLMTAEIPPLKGLAWSEADLAANAELLKKYGLQFYSAHVFTMDADADSDKLIGWSKAYGFKQFIIPLPRTADKASYEEALPAYKNAAGKLAQAGIQMLIHNDKTASEAVIDGMSAFEWFLHACDGAILAQPDLGWLIYAGIDPESFLWRNEKYIASLHYKDFEKTADGFSEIAIGRGEVDMMACFQFARYKEIIQLVDQDSSRGDMYEDLEDAMHKFGWLSQGRDNSKSILCTMNIETGEVQELQTFDHVIEAPNWYQHDPDLLFYNSEGHLYRYSISTGESACLESGGCIHCNNDHVLSADGKEIAVSHSNEGWASQVYIFPIEGGEPRLITKNWPSFLHGWSPDGKELAYCAFRGDMQRGEFHVDIYAISRDGGEEWPLTQNQGFNDGPEYSPDGEHILFISTRTGLMQNWIMNRDGSEQKQLTFSERNNWFGHFSPDGKKIVYLSYSKDGLDPNEHLPNMIVQLRAMNADGGNDRELLTFFGGQGSINVNSWSPDSKHFAFVKYELSHK